MVVEDRPLCFCKLENVDFYGFIYKGELCGHCAIRVVEEVLQIHIIMEKFSHKILKELAKDWKAAARLAKQNGCKGAVVYKEVTNDREFKLWEKFIKHFGFGSPKMMYTSTQEF